MRCPSCGAKAPDTAAVCRKCDHILDPSLFSNEPAELDDESSSPRARGAKAQPAAPSDGLDPTYLMAEVRRFFARLSQADKATFGGLCLSWVGCFFPWRDTNRDGEVLGLFTFGAAVFGLSMVMMFALVTRVRQQSSRNKPVWPWLVQFIGSGLSLSICLVSIKLATNTQTVRSEVGNYDRWASQPELGVFIALLGVGLALGGTLWAIKENP